MPVGQYVARTVWQAAFSAAARLVSLAIARICPRLIESIGRSWKL